MKKVFFIAGIALLTLSSCSKDWTCKCTQTGSSGTIVGTSSSTVTGKKNDVKTEVKTIDSPKEEDKGTGFDL